MDTLNVVETYVKDFMKSITVKNEDMDIVNSLIVRMMMDDNYTICNECQHAITTKSGERHYFTWYFKGYTVPYTEKLEDIHWICKAYEKKTVNLITGEKNITNIFCVNVNGKNECNGNCPRFKVRELSEFISEEDIKKVNDFVEKSLDVLNEKVEKEIDNENKII
jgi:hypothetical protein